MGGRLKFETLVQQHWVMDRHVQTILLKHQVSMSHVGPEGGAVWYSMFDLGGCFLSLCVIWSGSRMKSWQLYKCMLCWGSYPATKSRVWVELNIGWCCWFPSEAQKPDVPHLDFRFPRAFPKMPPEEKNTENINTASYSICFISDRESIFLIQ